jgi:hypothetical protein
MSKEERVERMLDEAQCSSCDAIEFWMYTAARMVKM